MRADEFPFLQHDGFIAVAHRGGAGPWPENSMRAFEGAIDLGYRYIETDVHVTRDGVLLAFHDDILDRATDGKGPIAALDYHSVKSVRIDGAEPIPQLADILSSWPNVKVNIDPKHDAAVDPLCDLLLQMNAVDRVCIGSFSDKRLKHVRDRLGESVCTSMGPAEVIRLRLASVGAPTGQFGAACAQVAVRHYGIPAADKLMVRAAQKRGMQLHVWTIDEEAEMERLIALGVDGIMTDEPARLKSVLKRKGLWDAKC